MMTHSITAEKAWENRLRRSATRQDLRLIKSRSRNPEAVDYGRFMIVDAGSNTAVAGELNTPSALSLDEVEAALFESTVSC